PLLSTANPESGSCSIRSIWRSDVFAASLGVEDDAQLAANTGSTDSKASSMARFVNACMTDERSVYTDGRFVEDNRVGQTLGPVRGGQARAPVTHPEYGQSLVDGHHDERHLPERIRFIDDQHRQVAILRGDVKGAARAGWIERDDVWRRQDGQLSQ